MRASRIVAAFFLLCATTTLAAPPRTFSEAKKIGWQLYGRQSVEFYCGCKFHGNRVDLKSCGYVPRKNAQRAARIEWEHIVPAWQIGHQRQCWQQGGRKHCSAHDDVYRRAEADLHNLVPGIGEVVVIRQAEDVHHHVLRQSVIQAEVDFDHALRRVRGGHEP